MVTDIEPIVVAWLMSPLGLIITAIVILGLAALSIARILTGMPSKE